jgi:hypothetical protein
MKPARSGTSKKLELLQRKKCNETLPPLLNFLSPYNTNYQSTTHNIPITAATMAEESPISYEDLANIEEDFEEIDTEIGMRLLRPRIHFPTNPVLSQSANNTPSPNQHTPNARPPSPKSPTSGL